jgi:hypothetical protein
MLNSQPMLYLGTEQGFAEFWHDGFDDTAAIIRYIISLGALLSRMSTIIS